ncbi:MAG: hypothetical protein AVDCRST_MAG59-5037 [uncultured Thermomicrobiales bacterium]|uniref:Uncharacterized protein n=1 Tax=uncultured Thermomicrobiales bacterium TaxID=1645740 RepID=A0A6J4VNB7_9BACT|nr:MAG: hypothetical protein AVDCRST_MAG59-5037 [uncultured Thermomicrobiales bacterium]
MDDRRFDELACSVAGTPSRRGLVRALASAAAGGLLAVVGRGDEALAAGCQNDGDCRACHRCQRKKGEKRGRCVGTCRNGQVCCAGRCGKPGPECCTSRADCGAEGGCMRCQIQTGRCEPEPDGRECAGCKRCKGGACTEDDPELLCDGVCCGEGKVCTDDGCCPVNRVSGRRCCAEEELCGDRCCPEDHACRNGRCCRVCGDACCGAGKVCVDGGVFGDTFCCDAATNTPCGKNGDGTYDVCCSNANEECCDGACVPKGECCGDGQRSAAGVCCPPREEPCGGRCCMEGLVCCHGECLHPDTRCCEPGTDICFGGGEEWCCPDDAFCCDKLFDGHPPACCPADHDFCTVKNGALACCTDILKQDCVGPLSPS